VERATPNWAAISATVGWLQTPPTPQNRLRRALAYVNFSFLRCPLDDPAEPGANDIPVKVYASSLNGYDYNVDIEVLTVEDGRIILTDGAGVFEAKGKR